MCKFFAVFLLLLTSYTLDAQILPREQSKLNYRLIGFSFPPQTGARTYRIEIATGNYYNKDSFSNKISTTFNTNSNKVVEEVPAFGQQYTWRTVAKNEKNEISKSELHHFSTLTNPNVDTGITRLRILKPAEQHKDDYIFMDGSKALYDMDGNPVWFLPAVEGVPAGFLKMGDLKASLQGTITFMSGRRNAMIYETDYNGTILWKGPGIAKVSGDSMEHYNHQFSRLANGHYMALGFEAVPWQLPGNVDSSILKDNNYKNKIIIDSNHIFYQRIFFYTLIEYDEQDNVVWTLRTSKYFKARPELLGSINARGVYDMDEMLVNSFYFDEAAKEVYLSLRDISAVLKVSYPSGDILATYGNKQQQGPRDINKDLFCWQHSCGHAKDGYIYLYNNNLCNHSLPKLTLVQDPLTNSDTCRKIWEYECALDGATTERQKQAAFASGGSVMELPDKCLFACMSNQFYTRVFIVNRAKETLWSALSERQDKTTHKWAAIGQYRASIITRKKLEQLIWNAAGADK